MAIDPGHARSASRLAAILALSSALSCGSAGGPSAPASGVGPGGAGTASTGAGDGGTGAVHGTTGTTEPGLARIGAHGLSYYRHGENRSGSISAPAMTTQSQGSTIVVGVGRGDIGAFVPPTDNKGNRPYGQLGSPHTYSYWPTSGTALYAFPTAVGGPNHLVTNSNAPGDEITLAVVEVTGSSRVQDVQWVERLVGSGRSITSAPVTTTGRATLIAFWWGDGGAEQDKVAVPNNGFVVLDSIGLAGSLVQCFVAAKEVETAGTYDVAWEATPPQGAQLWLVAVE